MARCKRHGGTHNSWSRYWIECDICHLEEIQEQQQTLIELQQDRYAGDIENAEDTKETACGHCGQNFVDSIRRFPKPGQRWVGTLAHFRKSGTCPRCYFELKEKGNEIEWAEPEWRSFYERKISRVTNLHEAKKLQTKQIKERFPDISSQIDELLKKFETEELEAEEAKRLERQLEIEAKKRQEEEAKRQQLEIAAKRQLEEAKRQLEIEAKRQLEESEDRQRRDETKRRQLEIEAKRHKEELQTNLSREASWAPLREWQKQARSACDMESAQWGNYELSRLLEWNAQSATLLADLRNCCSDLDTQIKETRTKILEKNNFSEQLDSKFEESRQALNAAESTVFEAAYKSAAGMAALGLFGGACYGCIAKGATLVSSGITTALVLGVTGAIFGYVIARSFSERIHHAREALAKARTAQESAKEALANIKSALAKLIDHRTRTRWLGRRAASSLENEIEETEGEDEGGEDLRGQTCHPPPVELFRWPRQQDVNVENHPIARILKTLS